ncbi:hypothetical protein HDG33_006342 [Paraburkholderia sp. Cpub6]|nr:hypothetical protein [Paraburkholderia sp. Cpub6]
MLRFTDAGREGLPRHDGFDGLEWIDACFLRGDQCRANLRVKAHLVIDRLALGRKTLFVLVLRLGEERTDQPVVEVQNFICQRRGRVKQDRNERGVTPVRFIFLDLIDGRLSAFTCEAQQAVLMDVAADVQRKVERADRLQAIDMSQNCLCARLSRRLPQPGQDGPILTFLTGLSDVRMGYSPTRRTNHLKDRAARGNSRSTLDRGRRHKEL